MLEKMGIRDPADLVTLFPRDWQDRRHRYSLREAPVGERTTVVGVITDLRYTSLRRNLGLLTATLKDASGLLKVVWFKKTNPRYDVFATLQNNLHVGQTLMVFGTMELGLEGRQLRVDESAILTLPGEALSPEDALHLNRIVPLYTVPEGLNERFIRSLVFRAVSATSRHPVLIPETIAKSRNLPAKDWAIRTIHFPNTLLDKERAREYLALEEFLLLETALELLRRTIKQNPKAHAYTLSRHLLTPFREHLGFAFTDAQKRVIREIFDDMMSPFPMNRLLQGDVGSGKTVVALSAMLLAVENGGQAALMAPTEILAEQHGLTFQKFLSALPVRWAVLTRSQSPAQRKKILQEIEKGEISLVIGTHALIQKTVIFKKLMLAVVDEQHRFGVEHRSLLRQKGTVRMSW
jgi:ATP-dependent DNA helicase RecG